MSGQSPRFDHSAGALCLDFLNTASTHDPLSGDDLRGFADLAEWLEEFGVLDDRTLALLRDLPEARQTAELEAAIAFRESLFSLLIGLAQGERTSPHLVTPVFELAAEAIAARQLTTDGDQIRSLWPGLPDQPRSLLWPLAIDAAALLASQSILRLAECGGDDCQWVFLRQARGRQRRWCSMSDCGNRAKAKRHYERTKRASRPDGQAGSNES